MAIQVEHIADVSFANHFLKGEAPVDGEPPAFDPGLISV